MAVLEAAATGDIARLQQMLAQGANPNEADGDGSTAVTYAVMYNHPESILVLVNGGALVDAKNRNAYELEKFVF